MENDLDLAIFLYGPALHHLDHLAPLAQCLGVPLFLTDEEIADIAKRYYPKLEIRLLDRLEAAAYLAQEYTAIISCLAKVQIDQLFFFAQTMAQRRIVPIWCPHGQSDKGHLSGFMKTLSDERAVLLYGPKMVELLTSFGIIKTIKGYAMTGNYRLSDYRTHRSFYDQKAKEILKKLQPAKQTFFYAPTWNDSEESSSFLDAYHLLIDHLPPDTNLIIKPHPNLVLQERALFEKIREELAMHPHILLLENFPLIFPLLAQSDLYIGDASSIGYDFLSFNKPMVFLNQNQRDPKLDPGLFLYRCGIQLTPNEYPQIYEKIENLLPYDAQIFAEARKEVDQFAFGDQEIVDQLKTSLETLLDRVAYDDLEHDLQ